MAILDRRLFYVLIAVILIILLSIIILLSKSNNTFLPKIIPINTETKISEKVESLELNIEGSKIEIELAIAEIDKLEVNIVTKNAKEKLESLKSRVIESIDKLEFMKSELNKLKDSEENIRKKKIKELIELCKMLEANLTIITTGVNIEMVIITKKDFTTAELFYLHEHLKSASAKLNNILSSLKELEMLLL